MPKNLNTNSIRILKLVSQSPGINTEDIYTQFKDSLDYKSFYNNIYRLVSAGLINRETKNTETTLWITELGQKSFFRLEPQRDGIWKLVIFDIPEKQKYVRVVLRAKLKALHFKKWQNSIWVSPYKLEEEIEKIYLERKKELKGKFMFIYFFVFYVLTSS